MSLLDTTQQALESAMSGSMLRQTLLTNNLANVDTPGYQPEDVNFQSTLSSGAPVRAVAHLGHLPALLGRAVRRPRRQRRQPRAAAGRALPNGLLYETLTQVAAQRESILENAMGMGQT